MSEKQPIDHTLDMPHAEGFTPAQELPVAKEKWKINAALVIIIGKPGTGKTITANKMKEMYGLKIYKAGQNIRTESGANTAQVQYVDRPVAEDLSIDKQQIEIIRNSTPENPKLIESHLGAWLAFQYRQENKYPIVVIKLEGEEEKRHTRLQKRLKEAGESLSLAEIARREKERAEKDRAQWAEAYPDHPELKTFDPYDDAFLDPRVDFTINTSNLTVEQTQSAIHEKLQERKMVEPKKPEEKQNGIEDHGQICLS